MDSLKRKNSDEVQETNLIEIPETKNSENKTVTLKFEFGTSILLYLYVYYCSSNDKYFRDVSY